VSEAAAAMTRNTAQVETSTMMQNDAEWSLFTSGQLKRCRGSYLLYMQFISCYELL
jgi:hypothetical protein